MATKFFGRYTNWAFHVYGPALRWNHMKPRDLHVPVYILHDPAHQYRRWFLCDRVNFTGPIVFPPRLDPKILPIGEGGNVTAAGFTAAPFTIETENSWNWDEEGPPRIEVFDGQTREDVFEVVKQFYIPRPESL